LAEFLKINSNATDHIMCAVAVGMHSYNYIIGDFGTFPQFEHVKKKADQNKW
jgi:hypothetical protein